MFDFIKNFFSGIAAFFSGLFGGKKSQNDGSTAPQVKKAKGYFLELDETGNTKQALQAKQPEPKKTEAASEVKQPEPTPTASAVATLEPPKAEAKPEAKKTAAAAATVKIEAQPNPPVASNGKVEPQAELTFAPNYLLPKASNSRRRPGPSMDTFRDMARQVKNPG